MRGERHERIADLVRKMLGHGGDKPQIGRFDLQLAGVFVLRSHLRSISSAAPGTAASRMSNGGMVT